MNALVAPVTCGHCAHDLNYINGAGGPTEQVAVAQCDRCHREWLVCVQLRPLVSDESRRRAEHRAKAGV